MKLLIVEDEKTLSDSVIKYLGKDYLCEQAFTFHEAVEKSEMYEYDCILLDLMLPDGNGLDILSHIKNNSPQAGIIIISAKDSVNDKVEGLKLGADDYLAKPFSLPELSMRIYALIRRKNFANNNITKAGNITIDLLSRTVTVADKKIELTKTEFELLFFLVENKNKVISKSSMAEHLSGDMADMMDNYNFVYAHIKNLKAKLMSAGAGDYIKTLYGSGYKWEEE